MYKTSKNSVDLENYDSQDWLSEDFEVVWKYKVPNKPMTLVLRLKAVSRA